MYLAPLNYDRFFKKVFSDKKIARRFLEDFLDVKITEMELLKEKNRVTDDAVAIEFDYRCKINGSYVIVDMQQWYKQDIGQRFYLYHALNTGLQLETLPKKKFIFDVSTRQFVEVRDYRALEPVLTLVWMVMDSMNFTNDFVSYAMTPDMAVYFIKNDRLWHNSEIIELQKEREKVLQLIENEAKGLGFLPRNRLIFMYQQNIVKNKAIKKYERWFEFAEKTLNENNKKEDFTEYENDEIFCDIIQRLNQSTLNDDDISYIGAEKKHWAEYSLLLNGMYDDGVIEGKSIGLKEGIEKGKELGIVEGIEKGKELGIVEGIEKGKELGIEEGVEKGRKEMALNMVSFGMGLEEISKITGIPIAKIQSWCN